MTVRKVSRYTVVCDDCSSEHWDPDADGAMGARISAGKVGWKFHWNSSGGRGQRGQRHFDQCPKCVGQSP